MKYDLFTEGTKIERELYQHLYSTAIDLIEHMEAAEVYAIDTSDFIHFLSDYPSYVRPILDRLEQEGRIQCKPDHSRVYIYLRNPEEILDTQIMPKTMSRRQQIAHRLAMPKEHLKGE